MKRLLSLLVDHLHELRDAVRVHKHALEAVVHADVVQDGDDDWPVALHAFGDDRHGSGYHSVTTQEKK